MGVGRLLSSGEDSVKEGESLLSMPSGSHLICYNTSHSISAKRSASSQSMYPDVKQEC